MPTPDTSPEAVVATERAGAKGPFVFVCEHASNRFPARWGTLGLGAAERRAHIAWDPGALGLARGLARHLDGALVHGTVSRLVYDCNRAPDMPGAMSARSETFEIPGNARLTSAERVRRTRQIYIPFHAALHRLVADRLARGVPTVIITVHSFTPVFFGTPRDVELGVIHDADATLALAVLAEAQRSSGLRVQLNAPYSAADDVTHTLRLHATPYGLPNVMLEIRNDLLADMGQEAAMAARLAPVLAAAHATLTGTSRTKVAV